MTSAEVAKQQELIEAEARQMRKERINADALEREEQMQQQPTLQQQQQDPRYYDPRAGKPTMPSSQVPLPRRGSLSAQRPDLSRPVPQPRQDRRPPVSFPSTFNARVDLPARDRRPLHRTAPAPSTRSLLYPPIHGMFATFAMRCPMRAVLTSGMFSRSRRRTA